MTHKQNSGDPEELVLYEGPILQILHEGKGILEAQCCRCQEIFNPEDEQDLEHIVDSMGDPCGGVGLLIGCWGVN